MTLLPIVDRELRVAARRRLTHWLRLVIALGALAIAGVILVANYGAPPQQLGPQLFRGLGVLSLIYGLLAGRLWTVDCLSEEKREGTLGLLFLTDLKGYDVVLGKLVAHSLNGFYGLLAVLPVLAIPVLLGGVTTSEFWRIALVLVNTFLFSLAIGVFCSALSREARHSAGANFALLLLLAAALPAIAGTMSFFFPARPLSPALFFSCPVYSFYLGFDLRYKLEPDHFWWSVAVVHVLTWLLVLLGSWITRFSWQDKTAVSRPEKTGRRQLWKAWSYGSPAKRDAFRKRLLEVNPYYWLAGRARLKPVQVWTFLGLMACWWLACWVTAGQVWWDEVPSITTALLLNTTLKLWITLEAGQRLAEDKKLGAMELLLSTPLTVRDFLRGQVLALRRQFFHPILAVIACEIVLMWGVSHYSNRRGSFVLAMGGAVILTLLADVIALSWVAMRAALTAKSLNRAVMSTVARLLVLPWAIFGAVAVIANVWYLLGPHEGWQPGWKFYLGWWFGLGLFVDLAFGLLAWGQLKKQFHQLATRQFATQPARLARWFLRRAADTTGSQAGVASTPDQAISQPHPPRLALKWAVIVGLASVAPITWMIASWSSTRVPLPVMVAISQTNTALRVFPGGRGVFLILPDGTLWRWGQTEGPQYPKALVPEQVGTNRNWVEARGSLQANIGLRQDGTLWQWGSGGNLFPGGTLPSREPVQVFHGHHWKSAAIGAGHIVAIKQDGTLWAWGDNSVNQLGNGMGTTQAGLIQVGTNRDWVAVQIQQDGTFGLRKDGTLWGWGQFYSVKPGQHSTVSLPTPTQICRETNWISISMEPAWWSIQAWNRSGELWLPLNGAPDPDASVASTGHRILSNSTSDHLAWAYCGETLSIYQVRADGALWENTASFWPWANAPQRTWRQVGRRTDWLSLWSGTGTAFGLTRDGTVWTWGIDLSGEPVADFSSRLRQLKYMVMELFGSSPTSQTTSARRLIQCEPRLLLRLVEDKSNQPLPTPTGK